MGQTESFNLRMMVFTSLFTALIIIGGYLSFPIPFSPVPIVLADFFAMLSGLFLGASCAGASVGLFLFLGALGLPVFAGGKAGLAAFFGPTGGFLFGYLASAIVIGLISKKSKPSVFKNLVAMVVGNVILYSMGVSWLKLMLKLTWRKTLVFGFLPFTPGIIIKIILALLLSQTLRPFFQQIIPQNMGK